MQLGIKLKSTQLMYHETNAMSHQTNRTLYVWIRIWEKNERKHDFSEVSTYRLPLLWKIPPFHSGWGLGPSLILSDPGHLSSPTRWSLSRNSAQPETINNMKWHKSLQITTRDYQQHEVTLQFWQISGCDLSKLKCHFMFIVSGCDL